MANDWTWLDAREMSDFELELQLTLEKVHVHVELCDLSGVIGLKMESWGVT